MRTLSGAGARLRELSLVALVACLSVACASAGIDAASGATVVLTKPVVSISEPTEGVAGMKSKVLIVAALAPNGGMAKIAKAIAAILDAEIKSPYKASLEELGDYSLIGFGSGIFDQKHHRSIFEFVDGLPALPGKKAFIFSTSGMSRQFALDHKTDDTHTPLRERLQSKGLELIGEYNCAGFNDNSFLKLFGGMNKGKPDAEDIRRAEAFALALKESLNIRRRNE